MPEVTVVGETEDAAPSSAEASAHEAAVAEGATAVQAEQAAMSAAEAKAAAKTAIEAAQASIEAGASVEQAAAEAAQSAAQAGVSLEMIHEQQQAMAQAINALAAELKTSRKQAGPPEPPKSAAPDHEPGNGPRWVRS